MKVGIFKPGHYVIRCYRHECLWWQTQKLTSIRKAKFSCRRCNATRKIQKENEYGLTMKLIGPMTGREAAKECAARNAEGKTL